MIGDIHRITKGLNEDDTSIKFNISGLVSPYNNYNQRKLIHKYFKEEHSQFKNLLQQNVLEEIVKIKELEKKLSSSIKQILKAKEQLYFMNKAQEVINKNKEIKQYIKELKNNNKLNTFYKIEDDSYYSAIKKEKIENATYKFIIELKKDYSDNFRTHYIFKFNDLLKKNEYIKEVSRKYKDKEKALKYIEGRKKYYKKYFKEEKPPLPVIYHTDNYYRNKKEEKKGKPLIYLHDIKLKGYKINKELIIK